MKKSLLALGVAAVVAASAMVAPHPAEARSRGGAVAAGVIGGIALGALAGSAMAGPRYYAPPPRYYDPGPVYYRPRCHWERERVFDGYGWRVQRVRVCY